MYGWGHARSNSSLLIAARNQFPQATIYFYGTRNHYERMLESVDADLQPILDSIIFLEMATPDTSLSAVSGKLNAIRSAVSRYLSSVRILWSAIRLCRKHHCDFVLFGSGSGFHIRLVKLLGGLGGLRCPALFIVHNWREPNRSLAARLIFPASLAVTRWPSVVRCYYIFLHGGMRGYLERTHRITFGDQYLDLAYPIVFGRESTHRTCNPDDIAFDFLSPSFKGVDVFCQYVTSCRERLREKRLEDKVSFGVIGGFSRANASRVASALEAVGVTRYPNDYLSEDGYRERLLNATYIVHLYDPSHYECRFSSAIQDGIAWRIPAIYLRNNYSQHIFDDLGTPGWQVDDLQQAVDVTIDIVESFNREAYVNQVSAVDQVRQKLSVENAGIQMQSISDRLGVPSSRKAM